jgi:phosphoglycolate phosphatase-like HAD superfamily hydrolase
MDLQLQLKNLKPHKDFFIGIDSDGCVFGSMEPKQKEFFCPNVLKHYGLFPISTIARETWEFVNLYSQTRGINRFLALITCFELLGKRKDVIDTGFQVPDLSALKKWTANETRLGNPTLEAYAGRVHDRDIDLALTWSKTINAEIKQWLHGIVPFAFVMESLDKITSYADAMVVSQTPLEALTREWANHDLTKFVRCIAGQEYGTKGEHLSLAAKNKYPDDRILMIGDAPGDLKAAKMNGVLFFPINPGNEAKSWQRFYDEGADRFFKGEFQGNYEKMLIEEFNQYLPEKPDWDLIQD